MPRPSKRTKQCREIAKLKGRPDGIADQHFDVPSSPVAENTNTDDSSAAASADDVYSFPTDDIPFAMDVSATESWLQ